MNIADTLYYGQSLLTQSDSPKTDSQYLLCHVLDCDITYLHVQKDKHLTDIQQAKFKRLIKSRQQGQPVAYLIGCCGFWTLDLMVTQDTLIPRADTELLVELALHKIKPQMVVADLGTGSGAVALAIAVTNPLNKVLAMDYSLAALEVARHNAGKNDINNVLFWQGSWLAAIRDNSIDMVVSNPPYIKDDDPHLLRGDVRFEPLSALTSGVDGLSDIFLIIKQAARCLKPSGWLLIEHGHQQAESVRTALISMGFIDVHSYQDLARHDRVMVGRLAA